jgi:predicted metalloendopeptidase
MSNVCQTAGKSIRDSLNSSVDPCDDFYEFACDGWKATHTIPPGMETINNFRLLREEAQNTDKTIKQTKKSRRCMYG